MKKQNVGRPVKRDNNIKYDLLIAALKLFAENNINDISLKDISANCGITSAMIHYYFGSKEQLLESIVTSFMIPNMSNIVTDAIKEENPIAMIEKLIENIINFINLHPYIAKIWSKNFFSSDNQLVKHIQNNIPYDLIDIFTEKIIKGQKEKIINNNLIAMLVYPTIISNIFIVMDVFNNIPIKADCSYDDKINHIKSFVLKGIKND